MCFFEIDGVDPVAAVVFQDLYGLKAEALQDLNVGKVG
jgi:hypothetical protein